jgi:hypothetical protein
MTFLTAFRPFINTLQGKQAPESLIGGISGGLKRQAFLAGP